MAWSEAARAAAARVRAQHAKAKAPYVGQPLNTGKAAWFKLARPTMRQRLATSLRNMRSGRTEGGPVGASSVAGQAKMAVQSTRARNYLRSKKR